jgi:hypothetical protein
MSCLGAISKKAWELEERLNKHKRRFFSVKILCRTPVEKQINHLDLTWLDLQGMAPSSRGFGGELNQARERRLFRLREYGFSGSRSETLLKLLAKRRSRQGVLQINSGKRARGVVKGFSLSPLGEEVLIELEGDRRCIALKLDGLKPAVGSKIQFLVTAGSDHGIPVQLLSQVSVVREKER